MNLIRQWNWMRAIAACLLALATVSHAPARAQAAGSWPSKPIRLIVPYAAGGGTDIVARLVGGKLAESLGRPVIVDNRPGGRTSIAYQAVLLDKADGHTLLFNNSSHNIQAAYKGLRYDPAADFTSFGSFGVGTASHLAGEILNGADKIDMTHVAYKGSAPALNDLLGEQIQALFVDPAAAIGYVKSGRLRALALSGSRRWKAYADVPTFGELGYKDLSGTGWWGLLVKRGTPPEVVTRLANELKKIVALPDVAERIEALGAEPFASTPQEFDSKIRVDMARRKRVVQDRNISLE